MRNVGDELHLAKCMAWLDRADRAFANGNEFLAGRLVERAWAHAMQHMGDGGELEAVLARLDDWEHP